MTKARFMRFLLVGVVNTIFSYSLFAFLLYFGLHYSLALLISTILGVLFNFKTTGKLVFKQTDTSLILHFMAVYTITYVVNVTLLGIVSGYVGSYIGQLLLVLPVGILSYLLLRQYVFY